MVLSPIFQGTNQGGSTVPLAVQPDYPIICARNLSECYSQCTVAVRQPTVYLWRGFRGARGLPIYPEGAGKTVCAQFCLMRYYSKGYPQGLQGSPTSVTTSCISCMHASPNPQVYVLNDRSRGLKMLEHISIQKKLLKIGHPTGPRKCSDTTCYALNLEDDTRIPNMRRNIPRT